MTTNMSALNLGGANVAFRVQHMQILGLITFYYSKLWIKFSQQGKDYTLKCIKASNVQLVNSHNIEKHLRKCILVILQNSTLLKLTSLLSFNFQFAQDIRLIYQSFRAA